MKITHLGDFWVYNAFLATGVILFGGIGTIMLHSLAIGMGLSIVIFGGPLEVAILKHTTDAFNEKK